MSITNDSKAIKLLEIQTLIKNFGGHFAWTSMVIEPIYFLEACGTCDIDFSNFAANNI